MGIPLLGLGKSASQPTRYIEGRLRRSRPSFFRYRSRLRVTPSHHLPTRASQRSSRNTRSGWPEDTGRSGAHHTPRQVLFTKQFLSPGSVYVDQQTPHNDLGSGCRGDRRSAAAHPAAAQGGVELTPWVGAYVPTSNSIGSLGEDISRDVSVAGGARLTFWGTGKLGFEVTGGYAPSKIGDETINETAIPTCCSPSPADAGALAGDEFSRLYIAGGPALLSRGNNPFDDDQSSTDLGGVLGLGFRFGGGDDNRIGFRIDLEDYLYNGDFGGGDDFQNDLVASVGVSFALGGSASQ